MNRFSCGIRGSSGAITGGAVTSGANDSGAFSSMPAVQTPLGAFVKRARRSLDLTQETVAELWGKSQSTVSDVERGVRGIDVEDVAPLARALRVSEEELFNAAFRLGDAEAGGPGAEPPYQWLPSGIRVIAIGPDGKPVRLSDEDLRRVDVHFVIAKERAEGN